MWLRLFLVLVLSPAWMASAVAASPAPAPASGGAVQPEVPRESAPAAAPVAPPAAPDPPQPPPADKRIYASISPFHLLISTLELTAEVRAHRNVGVAVIAAYGNVASEFGRLPVYELGGQAIAYPLGHFDHGLQLGGEVLYAQSAVTVVSGGQSVSAVAAAVGLGPLLGYKYTARIGFAFNIQAGAEYLLATGSAKASTGASVAVSASRWIPLVNLQVGWAFL